jgi:hypothetical protein
MAGSTIDLDEIAMPEILDPRKVKGCIPVCVPGTF